MSGSTAMPLTSLWWEPASWARISAPSAVSYVRILDRPKDDGPLTWTRPYVAGQGGCSQLSRETGSVLDHLPPRLP